MFGFVFDEVCGCYFVIFGLSWGIATMIVLFTVTQLLKTFGSTGLWFTSVVVVVLFVVL